MAAAGRASEWAKQVRTAVREYMESHPSSTAAEAKEVVLVPNLRGGLPDDIKAATMELVTAAMQAMTGS